MTTLPTPNVAAMAHSHALTQHILDAMRAAGGVLNFAEYMALALYAPGLGYYSAGSHKLGEAGDFITAPELSPLFGHCVAMQCQQIGALLPAYDILEIGAGSGKLARDMLQTLAQQNALPRRYFILEVSADLRAKQQVLLQTECPELIARVEWLDTLPSEGIDGVIVANEVIDAMPVHVFSARDGVLHEWCVTELASETFAWQVLPPTTATLAAALLELQETLVFADGYTSEINLAVTPWLHSLGAVLKRGVMLLFDYGYGRREYYHPERSTGTLMCYTQHRRHSNPFLQVGLQDITAHVDFTRVAESALDAGLQIAGYTTQAGFLLATGITDVAALITDPVQQYQVSQIIKRLTLPAEMGEAIKVMALSKHFSEPLLGFSWQDRRHDL